MGQQSVVLVSVLESVRLDENLGGAEGSGWIAAKGGSGKGSGFRSVALYRFGGMFCLRGVDVEQADFFLAAVIILHFDCVSIDNRIELNGDESRDRFCDG